MVNSVEYVTYSTFPFIPKFVISICDRLVTAQMPLYWFVVSAFLIIQIAQFANQKYVFLSKQHSNKYIFQSTRN